MVTVLKDSFKESFEGAYKLFEDKMIYNMTQFDAKVHQCRKEMMENRRKLIRVETGLRMVSVAKDDLAIELGNHTGHINRLDEGVRTIQVKVCSTHFRRELQLWRLPLPIWVLHPLQQASLQQTPQVMLFRMMSSRG